MTILDWGKVAVELRIERDEAIALLREILDAWEQDIVRIPYPYIDRLKRLIGEEDGREKPDTIQSEETP